MKKKFQTSNLMLHLEELEEEEQIKSKASKRKEMIKNKSRNK